MRNVDFISFVREEIINLLRSLKKIISENASFDFFGNFSWRSSVFSYASERGRNRVVNNNIM